MNCIGNPKVLYRGRDYSNRSYITLQGCISSHTLSPLITVYTTCSQQPSSGSPMRVSAMDYLNTQVSSPGLSPIQVPSAGSPTEVSTYGPERCVQGSATPNGRPTYPATCLLHHSPPLGSALPTASSILQHQKLLATPRQRTRVIKKTRGSIGFGPNAW